MIANTYKYVMYCEVQAQRIFLISFLELFPKNIDSSFSFEHLDTPELGFQNGNYNRSTILNTYKNQAKVVLEKYFNIDFFFVGLDYDDFSNTNFDIFCNELMQENAINKKLIFFIPLQCIEHWYYFVKTQNNASIKAVDIEKIPINDIKKDILS